MDTLEFFENIITIGRVLICIVAAIYFGIRSNKKEKERDARINNGEVNWSYRAKKRK